MPEIARRQQRPGLRQVRADRSVGGVELGVDDRALPAEPGPVGTIFPVALDREHWLDPVGLAQREIVLAMIRSHVDEAGAGIGRDELAGQERARLGKESAEVVHRVTGRSPEQ